MSQTFLKCSSSLVAGLLASFSTWSAELPAPPAELAKLAPEAQGYQLVAHYQPQKLQYAVDLSEQLTGEIERVGYYVKLVDQQNKPQWIWVSMKPFQKNLTGHVVPAGNIISQTYVNDLVVASNVPGVINGKLAKGNVEFWSYNYGGWNEKKLPGATGKYDFGDSCTKSGSYGSMQIHNYLAKTTLFSFNNFRSSRFDIGIGQNPKGNPDWTFARNGHKFKSVDIYILAKIKNMKVIKVVALNPENYTINFKGIKLNFKPGEKMVFTFKVDTPNASDLTQKYFWKWYRNGDDKKSQNGLIPLEFGKEFSITTSLDRPGFVRMCGFVVDKNGKRIKSANWRTARTKNIFDGGAGVDVDKIKPVNDEPQDFDQYWQSQKARLKAVKFAPTYTKLPSKNSAVECYFVSVPTVDGTQPMTGVMTIPADKSRKYPAQVSYHGYGTHTQGAITNGPRSVIYLNINAHGYKMGQNKAYYKKFFQSIKHDGKIYAWSKKQNSNRDTAYFNGMVLRVLRSLELVKSRPEWDHKNLQVSGGSQGGLQTLWAAGLDSDVSKATPSVPWCCDLNGRSIGRQRGWFMEYTPALGYYDAINHAKRIKCPVIIRFAGLGDYTCPPSGVAALYNTITAPKKIFWIQNAGHGWPNFKPSFVFSSGMK